MVTKSLFECVCCHADVVLSDVCVVCRNRSLVYYVVCHALPTKWAIILNPTIATVCNYAWCFAFSVYAGIMFRDDRLNVVHATIANLDCVSVKKFMKLVPWWEMFVNKAKKVVSDVCFDITAERRVKPDNIAVSFSACLLWCF